MKFIIDNRLLDLFPELTIGVVVLHELDNSGNSEELNQFFQQVQSDFKQAFPFPRIQDHPYIRPWREAFSRLDISASKFHSSVEAMGRRILKGNYLPSINNLVNLYNALSVKHLIPIGGHDLGTIKGNICLCFANGGEKFLPLGSQQWETVPSGEVVYKDEQEVLTRRWVWRQCEKDKVTHSSRQVFIPIDVLGEIGKEKLVEVIADFTALIPRYLSASTSHYILNGDNQEVTIL